MKKSWVSVVVRCSVLVIEPVETNVYSNCINRAIANTECQISRNITRNLLAIFIFADSFFELGVELGLQLSHGSLNIWVADDGICSSLWYTTCNVGVAEVVWQVTDTRYLVY